MLTSFHLTFVEQTALKNLFATVCKQEQHSVLQKKQNWSQRGILSRIPWPTNDCQRIVNLTWRYKATS